MKNIALVGFMGSGKTTAGPILAAETGLEFVDLDEVIEQRSGKPINSIFQDNGEAEFRMLESQALADVAGRSGLVVSCGGGVVVSKQNRKLLRSRFHVIYLDLSLRGIRDRLQGSTGRPLIQVKEPAAKIKELYSQRLPLYKEVAALTMQVDDLPPSKMVEQAVNWLAGQGIDTRIARIPVRLEGRSYDVIVGAGVTDRLLDKLRGLDIELSRVALVASRRVWKIWGAGVESKIDTKTEIIKLEINDSERSKSLAGATRMYDRLIAAGVDRQTPIVAVGGGVIGDLAGFVASTYMRGVPLVHLPTTLLAQVDSSIGGKTAVNHPHAKNIIGTFYQPRLVLADTTFLSSLPQRQLRSGLAEVIKYALLDGGKLIDDVDAAMPFLLLADAQRSQPVIAACARAKAEVVAADEKDTGLRAILNYGHTVGHAIESACGYKGWTHGEAVAVGMLAAGLVSQATGGLAAKEVETHRRLLEKAKLPTSIGSLDPGDLVKRCLHDKKTIRGGLNMVLLEGLGKPVVKSVSSPVLKKALSALAD